jgi:hypothetical protein
VLVAPIVIAAAGWIGSLNIDTANAAQVVALYGRPDTVALGRGDRSAPPSVALGYGCSAHRVADGWAVGRDGPYCRTVYWADAVTGVLGDFFTSSPAYAEAHGVRIGMPTVVAERLLHERAQGGCSDAIRRRRLTIWISGGTLFQLPTGFLRVIGGHVGSFFVLGRNELGIFDC